MSAGGTVCNTKKNSNIVLIDFFFQYCKPTVAFTKLVFVCSITVRFSKTNFENERGPYLGQFISKAKIRPLYFQ